MSRMETGRWYPENEAEKSNQAVGTFITLLIVVGLYLVLGKLLLIG